MPCQRRAGANYSCTITQIRLVAIPFGCGSFRTALDEDELIAVFKFRREAVAKDPHPFRLPSLLPASNLWSLNKVHWMLVEDGSFEVTEGDQLMNMPWPPTSQVFNGTDVRGAKEPELTCSIHVIRPTKNWTCRCSRSFAESCDTSMTISRTCMSRSLIQNMNGLVGG